MPAPPTRRDVLAALAASAAVAGLPGRARATEPVTAPPDDRPVVSFVINVQDFLDPVGSARTLERMCASFARHGVRGDFYLTAPMVRLYQQHRRTDVLEALRGQGISYHVRPPHPLFHPFDARLSGLDAAALRATLRQFETQALDLATGQAIPDQPGGFAHVTDVFGRAPACVGLPNPDRTVKQAAMDVYRNMGARGVVWYHGERTKVDSPFEKRGGLLARPADIVVDRWLAPGERRPQLWWNRAARGGISGAGDPRSQLDARIAGWKAPRPPFVLLPIHEDNVTRSGPDAWRDIYWADTGKSRPKSPPYDLSTREVGQRRSDRESDAILDAYDALIAHCATRYRVLPMDGVVALADAAGVGGDALGQDSSAG